MFAANPLKLHVFRGIIPFGMRTAENNSLSAIETVEAPASGERVLVIEDDRAVQKALRRLFEGEGFPVDVAGNGVDDDCMCHEQSPYVC